MYLVPLKNGQNGKSYVVENLPLFLDRFTCEYAPCEEAREPNFRAPPPGVAAAWQVPGAHSGGRVRSGEASPAGADWS